MQARLRQSALQTQHTCHRRAHLARRAHCQSATNEAVTKTSQLKSLLEKCQSLGTCRFIVIGEGAILESVSKFSKCSYTEIPNKGTLATVSLADKTFECHIFLDKVKQVKFASSKAKAGDYLMYATRFVGEGDKVLMSLLLHGQQGQYDAESLEAWRKLQADYGEVLTL